MAWRVVVSILTPKEEEMIDQRWKDRVTFLGARIRHLRGQLPDNDVSVWVTEDWAMADKIYQLEEELNLKTELLARWAEAQKTQAATEEEQKIELQKEFKDKLRTLKGLTVDGKMTALRKGVLERDGKGSHAERWRDYTIAKNIINSHPKLVKA